MGDVQLITGPKRAEAVARELNSGQRTRPAVVVSTPSGASGPWIDAERLVSELGDLTDVYVLSTAESSWAFSSAMPSRTQVYGGAGRVYPVNLDWVHDPTRSRLRFAYTAADGELATARLIEDGLAAAVQSGALALRRGTASAVEVTGKVKGCPTASQALVALGGGGYASIQMGMAVPGVASDRVFAVGMRVRGVLDEEARRLDVRGSLPDPAARMGEIGDGEVIWARVESVGSTACEIAAYPGVPIRVSWQEVTTSAADDLRDLMSVGEIVAVRAARSEDGVLALSLIGFDEKEPPRDALSVFPDGPPWLLPPEPVERPRPEDPFGGNDVPYPEPDPVAIAGETVPVAISVGAPPDPTDSPASAPEPSARAAAAAPAPAATPSPRPSPMLMPRQAPKHPLAAALTADQATATATAAAQAAALEATRQLKAASAETARLEAIVKVLEARARTTETNLRSAQTEIRLLQRDLSEQARDLAARETDLRRLRARLRKNVQEERRVAGRREATPGEALFLDPAEQFRFDVNDRWARRIPAAEKADRPLRDYRFGPRFLDSFREIEGVDRSKLADVVVDVLTNRAESSAGRDMHPLRSGTGGDDEVLRRDGYTCWRVAIQRRSPQARRLHFWRSADDIELSRVVLHDDYAP